MSLLTRCPACITLYRVVPDQLRISDGWVKCGQCGEIFDASQYLVEEVCDPAPQSGVPSDTVPAVDAPATPDFEETLWMNPLATAPTAVAQVDLELDGSQVLGQSTVLVPQSPIPDEPPGPLTGGEKQDDVAPLSGQAQIRWDDEPPAPPADVAIPAAETIADAAKVTFLAGPDRASLWHKPLVRVTLWLLCLLLGLSLAAQWVYVARDQLAAKHPELAPALQVFCGVANCQVQTLKRIESLSVDSVEFHLLGKDTYRLTFAVKNAAVFPLALPNVELTLTDTGDQPVFRRVFSAQELLAAQAQIPAGDEWPVVADLLVKPVTADQRVLGYRLLIFYP